MIQVCHDSPTKGLVTCSIQLTDIKSTHNPKGPRGWWWCSAHACVHRLFRFQGTAHRQYADTAQRSELHHTTTGGTSSRLPKLHFPKSQ